MPANNTVRPLRDIGGRPQEHGRIRSGIKGDKGQPKAIKTWRFTSHDQAAIAQLAEIYGGEARPWYDAKANPQNQHEVITKASSINIMLVPEALSVWYEKWTGKGCERRCDGETTKALTSNPNDPIIDVPCICSQNGYMECKPKSRLKVLLPEIRMAGFWRMETNSWGAVEELSAMERALATMQQYGILYARLALVEQSIEGGRRKYVIPRLEFNETSQALIAGAGAATVALGNPTPGQAALPAGDAWVDDALSREIAPLQPIDEMAPFGEQQFDQAKAHLFPDDDIVEAEIVEEDQAEEESVHHTKLRARMHATITDVAKANDLKPDELRHGMVLAITSGTTSSSNALRDEDVSRIIDYLEEVLEGERTVQIQDGEVRLPKVTP